MSDQQDLHRRLERLERLRKLGVRRGVRDQPVVATGDGPSFQFPVASYELPASSFESSSPARKSQTPFGPAWVRTARYPLAQRPDLAEWLTVQPETLAALDRNDALLSIWSRLSVAFIDTETTGLSLGAGTYTFLIGVGTYENPVGLRDPQGLALRGPPVLHAQPGRGARPAAPGGGSVGSLHGHRVASTAAASTCL